MPHTEAFTQEQILTFINQLPFFNKFTLYEKKRICGHHASFETYKAGTRIITAGSNDTSFFIIITGSASVQKQHVDIIGLNAGEFFGEMAFLTNNRRTSDVVANETCLLLKIDQSLMNSLSAEIREKIKDRLIEKLVERLEKSTERLRVRM